MKTKWKFASLLASLIILFNTSCKKIGTNEADDISKQTAYDTNVSRPVNVRDILAVNVNAIPSIFLRVWDLQYSNATPGYPLNFSPLRSGDIISTSTSMGIPTLTKTVSAYDDITQKYAVYNGIRLVIYDVSTGTPPAPVVNIIPSKPIYNMEFTQTGLWAIVKDTNSILSSSLDNYYQIDPNTGAFLGGPLLTLGIPSTSHIYTNATFKPPYTIYFVTDGKLFRYNTATAASRAITPVGVTITPAVSTGAFYEGIEYNGGFKIFGVRKTFPLFPTPPAYEFFAMDNTTADILPVGPSASFYTLPIALNFTRTFSSYNNFSHRYHLVVNDGAGVTPNTHSITTIYTIPATPVIYPPQTGLFGYTVGTQFGN